MVMTETVPITDYIALPHYLKDLIVWGGSRVPLERLDELRKLHHAFFPVKYSDSFYEKIVDNTYPCIILYERLPSGFGRIVGFASSIIYKDPFNAEPFKGYLATLGVRPEWRNRGIAKVLIRSIEAYLFKNYQIEYVELHVLHSNIAARRLYESLKYTMIAFLEKHYVFEDPKTGNRRHDAYLYRRFRNASPRGVSRRSLQDWNLRGNRPIIDRKPIIGEHKIASCRGLEEIKCAIGRDEEVPAANWHCV